MSPFLREHLLGALVLGSAFGTAIGFSLLARQLDGSLLHSWRIFLSVSAVALIKFLFDAAAPQVREVSLGTLH